MTVDGTIETCCTHCAVAVAAVAHELCWADQLAAESDALKVLALLCKIS